MCSLSHTHRSSSPCARVRIGRNFRGKLVRSRAAETGVRPGRLVYPSAPHGAMHAIVDPGSADTRRKVIHAGGTVADVRHAKQREGTSERLSIVMPVYNEAAVIEDVVDELRREVADHFDDAELVLVNDASTDDTASILDQLAATDSRLRIVHAERNGGHGPALRRALDESSGDWIFQIDSDGQQVGAEFWQLWERRVGAGLVMGMRVHRRNGWHRLLVSAVARYLNRMNGGGDIRDLNVPFKLISRTLWEDVAPYIPASRWPRRSSSRSAPACDSGRSSRFPSRTRLVR